MPNFHLLIYQRTEAEAIPLYNSPECTLAYRRGYNYMLKLCIDLASLRPQVPDRQDFSRGPHWITPVLKPTRPAAVIPFRAPPLVDFHHFAYGRNNSPVTRVSVSVSPNIQDPCRIESKRGISPLSARCSMASFVKSTTLHRCSLRWLAGYGSVRCQSA